MDFATTLQTILPELAAQTLIILGLFAIGLAQTAREIIKAKRSKNWEAPFVIAVCVTGLLFASALTPGFSALAGIVVGFAASGAVTIAGVFGKKSGTPDPEPGIVG